MDARSTIDSEPVCPRFHAAIELVGRRWSGAILCALIDGERRFGDLTRLVSGVSDRLLSARLRELEAEGLVERAVESGSPVKVVYRLTEKGRELEPAILELRRWADRWSPFDANGSNGSNGKAV